MVGRNEFRLRHWLYTHMIASRRQRSAAIYSLDNNWWSVIVIDTGSQEHSRLGLPAPRRVVDLANADLVHDARVHEFLGLLDNVAIAASSGLARRRALRLLRERPIEIISAERIVDCVLSPTPSSLAVFLHCEAERLLCLPDEIVRGLWSVATDDVCPRTTKEWIAGIPLAPRTIARLFGRAGFQSPGRLIGAVRQVRAVDGIRSGMSTKQVAARSGYISVAQMNAASRRLFGATLLAAVREHDVWEIATKTTEAVRR
jgi:AraC-like DNA-binding protein